MPTPELRREAVDMAFFLQGALLAGASHFASATLGALRQPSTVHQPVDDNGDAKGYFQVILPSGIVLEVSVRGLVPNDV